MRLAWRNLLHDRIRFAVTVIGIAFAVFLMIFEGSLLTGFLSASSGIIDATDADLWVTARGVRCFEFPGPILERFRAMALGVDGVERVDRIATSFGEWQRPDGALQTVIIIGPDVGVGKNFPRPLIAGQAELPESVLIDQSDAGALGMSLLPAQVEISGSRAQVLGVTSGFGSFLGSPYVFTTYPDALRYAGIKPERTTFLLVAVAQGHAPQAVKDRLQALLPETNVWTRSEFSNRARTYWVAQTGAGGAILTAGLLGFIVGVVIVSQTIYATTMENIEEFATLKAMGATAGFVRRLVVLQALVGGLAGYILGLGASLPVLAALRTAIPWVQTPWWLPAGMLLTSLIMCGMASVVSIRKVATVEPGRVFRA